MELLFQMSRTQKKNQKTNAYPQLQDQYDRNSHSPRIIHRREDIDTIKKGSACG